MRFWLALASVVVSSFHIYSDYLRLKNKEILLFFFNFYNFLKLGNFENSSKAYEESLNDDSCEDVEVPMCATLGYNHTNVKLSPLKDREKLILSDLTEKQ